MPQIKFLLYLWQNVTINYMKNVLKITFKSIGLLLLIFILMGGGAVWYIYTNYLSFEDDFPEKKDFTILSENGYKFLDRNGNGILDVYEDERRPLEARVKNALELMTLEEKIHLLKGSGMKSGAGLSEPGEGIPGAVGTIVPTPRLGLPTIYLSDGPAGLRIEPFRENDDNTYYCTAFPIATLLASTWNTDLVNQVGNAMGNEALEYGIDVILGPGANIHRHPFCGRNFEYYSEDPFLSGKIGASMVKGIQANGVGTSVKHFVANNQETDRVYNDVTVSERALREIYMKGFEIISKEAQPWTIMSSYNLVNGIPASESPYLLTEVLRDDWGFQGVVMSDWFGGNNAVNQVNAGNDLLEPGTKPQWKALKKAAKDGSLSEKNINTSVERILRLVFMSKKMKNYQYSNKPDLEKHALITRNSASEGMVLLKNEGVLPLSENTNVALLGTTSYNFIAGGTGSGKVNGAYTISLEQGMLNSGFLINQTAKELYNKFKEENQKEFEESKNGGDIFSAEIPPQMSYSESQLSAIASSAEVCVITIGRNAGEGSDRILKDDFLMTESELDLIRNTTKAFHEKGKKVIVVLNISGVVETASWKEIPDAILLAWQGGQEGGNSAADILSGRVNPSGKLPMTFPINVKDYISDANFPQDGKNLNLVRDILFRKDPIGTAGVKDEDFTNYDEGIYVGYRDFDTNKKEVSYPFGFGLSYSQFEIDSVTSEVHNDTISISLTVSNVGSVAGKEVVQIYISKPNSTVERAEQELKSFAKTKGLLPNESQKITLSIPVSELSYWDESRSNWTLEKGEYDVRIGFSSREIKLLKTVSIN